MQDKYANEHVENNVDFIPLDVVGKYDIPLIRPEKYKETTFIPFSSAQNVRNPGNYGIHFFIYDYQFSRIWNKKSRYLNLLSQFKAVMSPDFSTYTDWPMIVQLFNHYRKHLLAAWMQDNGIVVYPSISWSDERSYEWCFDGEPEHAAVCVSSVGTQKNAESRRLFRSGYDRMLEVLRPETIIFYGDVPEGCQGNIVHIESYQKKLREIKRDET